MYAMSKVDHTKEHYRDFLNITTFLIIFLELLVRNKC